MAILIGIAKAVHFLHTGIIPGCFRNRPKTGNILLDEHLIAKASVEAQKSMHNESSAFGQAAVITPWQVTSGLGSRPVKSIAAAKHHTVIATESGEVFNWGSNRVACRGPAWLYFT